jgi:cytochrome c oxidase subunit II
VTGSSAGDDPLGRQPVSSTPGAPADRGTPQPGTASGEKTAAAAGGRARWRRLLLVPALLAGVLVSTTGCTSNLFTRLGMPVPVTKQGQAVLTLWQGSWIAAFGVGFVVWGLIIWAIIFHRKRSADAPAQVRYNLPIEMLYTVVPFIMIGVLFFFTARDENYINKMPSHPDVRVTVTAYQWSWQFQYPQYHVPGGSVTMNGQPWSPGPLGDSQLPLLVIPTHETVQFDLVSTDVVHSFWIVPFEFKRDVIPGHPNHFTVTPTRTGTFIGRCTELCGLYHSRMLFKVKIVTPAQFRTWIHAQQAAQSKSAGSAQ